MSSTIDPTTASATTGASKSATTTNPGLNVNETQFLQLMVTQLQDQDPLNASNPTDFVSQVAQMTSVEQETNTATNTQNSEYFSLLGHTVTYNKSDGTTGSGVVQQVSLGTSGATLTVGGVDGITASSVTSVS